MIPKPTLRGAAGALALIALLGGPASAQQSREKAEKEDRLSAIQIVESSQRAFYYQAKDMKADVVMDLIAESGGKRTRAMTMLRRNATQGQAQKYFIYFHKPGDVRRMSFMVWKYPKKEDDRWIFVPAVDLIRRIAADDQRSSFVGSDFTYEDVSGRDVASDSHDLLRSEKLTDRECHVIESIPIEPTEYTKRPSWIDRETLLPLREEYYDAQDELYRVFTADRIEAVEAGEGTAKNVFPTVTRRTMKNLKTGHRTEVDYTSITYDLGLKDEDFSERHMRRPPRAWIR